MTSANFTPTPAADALKTHCASAVPSTAAETAIAAIKLVVHPATFAGLTAGASLAHVSLLDFLIDAGWEHARDLATLNAGAKQ